MTDKAFILWRFEDAPQQLQDLSGNGGDEDWVLLCPAGQEMPWCFNENRFGCSNIDSFYHPDGRIVYIGCHA